MERATVNGVELEYEVKGSGDPLLLIHGAHVADLIAPLMSQPALADRCQLIRYHRRGFAGSTHTPPPVSISYQAADAAALLAHVGIERAHIAGHSYGGSIALQLAVERPDLVHSLALLEPALLMVPAGESFFQQVGPSIEAHASGEKEKAVGAFLAVVSGVTGRVAAP
ncbi:MAG: alpha/beta hydrolase [Dehalococcoidia bacterium]